MALTPKQMKFCQGIASGLSQKDAYISAYDTDEKSATAYVESSKLMLREDIREYIKTLQKPIEECAKVTAISEREKKRAVLWSIIESPDSSNADRCRALDILNKMDTEYINVNKTVTDTESSIDALDVETLKKLAGDA